MRGAEPVVRRDRERDGSVDARDLFDANRVRGHVHARTAVGLGDADPEQAHLGELRYELGGEPLCAIPLLGVGGDLGAGELADALS